MGLLIVRKIYWDIGERKANKEKPKTRQGKGLFEQQNVERSLFICLHVLIFFQLIGWKLLPITTGAFIAQIVGFLLVIAGFIILIISRKKLATNWTTAFEHQIRDKQELITKGIYGYTRNPIYLGIAVMLTGIELVAKSYIFLIFPLGLLAAYIQSKREEKLLGDHFGKEYARYRKKVKLLVPFVF